MNSVSLQSSLQQQLRLSANLLQSVEILQMNAQELLEYLSRVVEENPVLDQEDSPALQAAYTDLRREASWTDGGGDEATFVHDDPDQDPAGGAAAPREGDSLSAFLCDQLDRRKLAAPLRSLAKYIAELLDEHGFLPEEELTGLRELRVPDELISQAVGLVQSLEPAGVAASDLKECLLLQLDRRGLSSPLAREIISHYLPELGRKQHCQIAKKLNITPEEVRTVEDLIRQLDPCPGQAFLPAEPILYVRPDISIVEKEGQLEAVLNDSYLPRISISGYYARLLKEVQDNQTKGYLQEKMQQAKWVISSLQRRGSTLQAYANELLRVQYGFFAGTSRQLTPMNLTGMAELLGVHPSTVSRTTRGKYLQCRQGTFPLNYFFSHAVGEGADCCSEQAVKQKIARLIREEDARKPLSDQKLCDLLKKDGVEIARRTVAKYRMALDLPSAALRKR